MAQKSQPMGFLAGKRGATMAPSIEKPTATTVSSAHCSKTGTPGCSRLTSRRTSPRPAKAKERKHMYQASQTASRGLSTAASLRKSCGRLFLDGNDAPLVSTVSFICASYLPHQVSRGAGTKPSSGEGLFLRYWTL